MKADLHNHSIYSDGRFTILELYNMAVSNKIDMIAITDHDSVDAYNDIKSNNLERFVLIGVELSTDMNGEDIHILGYFYNNNEPPVEIRDFLDSQRIRRKKRVYKIINKLKKHFDIEIDYKDIIEFADGAIGRPHVAWAIEKKYGIPFKEVFDKYIGNGQKAYVSSDKLDTRDAIKLLRDNNALVVIAHPKLIKKNNIESIIEMGVDGIEVNYPQHDDNDRKMYGELAQKYNLIITGGSDFHDKDISTEMGNSFIGSSYLNDFLNKIYK